MPRPPGRRHRLPQRATAMLALAPGAVILASAFFGCILWTAGISFTSTRLLPHYDFVGLRNYRAVWEDERFRLAFGNLLRLAVVFVPASLAAGLLLAIGVDRLGARARPVLRMIYLYPLSVSWLVSGLVWQWILDPGLGLEPAMRALGWSGFRFDALVRPETALYAVAGAACWHFTGFVMVVFLAGLGGVDPAIWQALQVEGVPAGRAYLHVVLPMLRGYTVTAALLLAFAVARMFDLVVAMTGGGPGFATDLPTIYIYDAMFPRSRAGTAAAAAILLMLTMLLVLAPYLAANLRRRA